MPPTSPDYDHSLNTEEKTYRDGLPGRIWSRLTKAQRHLIVEMYGAPHRGPIDQRTYEALERRDLVNMVGPEHYILTGRGLAVAHYRLSLSTEGLHHRDCDRVRDSEACCHPHCPVFCFHHRKALGIS